VIALFRIWPDALGPLGFKVLSMEQDGVHSALAEFTWEDSLVRMTACSRCGALAPRPGCTCGLHASYSAGHVLDQYAQYRERFLVVVEAQGQAILHEHGWRAEYCAVHAIVELYAGNVIKHMQLLRAARCLGNPPLIALEDAIGIVQDHRRSYLRDGDWQASWRTDPGAFAAAGPAA
jgi:hypothetical protein